MNVTPKTRKAPRANKACTAKRNHVCQQLGAAAPPPRTKKKKKKKVGRILDQPVKWRILDQWWCLVYIYL
eukprot:COSAG04_NODE_5791_length_1492_cov_6.253410_2_plen_70_part_00